MFSLHGSIIAHPGGRDELAAILLQAAQALQANPACHQYVVSLPHDEPDAVSVFEVWESEEAHAASLQPEEIKALIGRAMPLIAGMGTSTRGTVRGGKGV